MLLFFSIILAFILYAFLPNNHHSQVISNNTICFSSSVSVLASCNDTITFTQIIAIPFITNLLPFAKNLLFRYYIRKYNFCTKKLTFGSHNIRTSIFFYTLFNIFKSVSMSFSLFCRKISRIIILFQTVIII